MNLIDTSGWIEILTDGPQADIFVRIARSEPQLLVPALVAAEVAHHVQLHLGEQAALDALAAVSRGTPAPFTVALAGMAARVADEFGLSFRQSLIYAHARQATADLWTMDPAFENLPRVRYLPPRPRGRSIH
jgi:predicted nucleic acid-binding protein